MKNTQKSPVSDENAPSSPEDVVPLRLSEKLCYGLGDVSNGLALSTVSFWLLIYLTDATGLGPKEAALAMGIGRIWDALTDPVMGWITDHTESRWGKRRPYLLFGAIPYAFAYFALWSVPEFSDPFHSFLYVTTVLIVFNTCLTVVFVPYTTLTASMTVDYNERTSLTGYRMTSSQVAFLIGASVPFAIVNWVTSADRAGKYSWLHEMFGNWAYTPREGYLLMAALFSLLMLASIWTTFLGTHEREGLEEHPEAVSKNRSPFSYVKAILEQLRNNHPFRIAVTVLLLSNSAISLVAVSLPYYIQYVASMKEQLITLYLSIFLVAIMSIPIWTMITKQFGKTETYRVAMICYVGALCSLAFIQPGQNALAHIIAGVCGVFHGAAIMIPWAIIPDVTEYDELTSGERRGGLFYGGATFSYKFATAFAVIGVGLVLHVVGYVANQPQTPLVASSIRVLIGPAPSLILLAAAIFSLRYPLTAEKHAEILKQLEAKRQK